MNLREGMKALAGRSMALMNPQCRYDRCTFVLAHMRCGSTALSNVLCSRSDISGYGEAHVRYLSQESLGRLVVNQAIRRGWRPQARMLFDKLLHNRHDAAVPETFFTARAIFVLREPVASARSVRKLFSGTGKKEYRTDAEALSYYCDRVEHLAQLWPRFAADRRFGITHRWLMTDPDGVLSALTRHFGFAPPLKNSYRSNPASRRGGGGDPIRSGTLTRIEAQPYDDDTRSAVSVLDAPETLRLRAQAAHDRLAALFDTTSVA